MRGRFSEAVLGQRSDRLLLKPVFAIDWFHDENVAEYGPLYTKEGYAATTPGPDEILIRMSQGPVWVLCAMAGSLARSQWFRNSKAFTYEAWQ